MSGLKITVTKDFFLLKILLCIIYIVLEVYYHFYISARFDYMGYIWDLNLFKYLITKIIFLVLLAASGSIYDKSKFLYTIYLLLIFFFYIPSAILFSFGNFPTGPFVSYVFFVLVFLLAPYFRIKLPSWHIQEKNRIMFMAGLVFSLMLPIIITFGTHVNFKTLFLSEIYETRKVFSEKLTGILAYIYNIQAKTVIPVSLIFFLICKKYYMAALSFFMLVYLYVISGNKLVYFTSILVMFFYYIGKTYTTKLSNFFLVVLIAFFIFPLIDNFILPEPMLTGIFINRFLFIPALLTQFYFDFFDGNPFFFAESNFFNLFVKSPYDMPVGFMITREYWNEPDVYANNGIVSDGFMNLDYPGVVIFSILFAGLFGFFNSLSVHRDYYGIFFGYIYIILSAPFLSTFVTGGILIFIFLAMTMLRNNTALQKT